MNGIYEFKKKDYQGNEIDFSNFKGKVLLIVNTATKCGFTNQYDGLVELYRKYHNQGLEILDFPCNQFLFQSPGTGKEIHDFCYLKFMIDFLQFEKIKVNGKEEDELFSFLKKNAPKGKNGRIKWNFTKFLINKEGKIVDRFEPKITPQEIEKDIVSLLK